MKAGEEVLVKAYKADGACYRWWTATVEAVYEDEVVTFSPAGHRVEDPEGGWTSQQAIRAHYWPNKWMCLLEVYAPDGSLEEVFVNLNSPVVVAGSTMGFTDYELDVSRVLPEDAVVVDQDEFAEAAVKYGYPEEFQRFCHQVITEAVELANGWSAKVMPYQKG